MKFNRVFASGTIILLSFTSATAQTSVNANVWHEQTGLTVASVQEVKVKATKIRLFTTLSQVDDNAKQAVLKLAERKKLVAKKLEELGAVKASIQFTPTKLLEWELQTVQTTSFWQSRSDGLQVPSQKPLNNTAYTSLRADYELKEGADESLLLPIEISERLRNSEIFSGHDELPEDFASEVYLVFVGSISEAESNRANKLACEEAAAQATALATLAGLKLGEIEAIEPQVDGMWRYQFPNIATNSGQNLPNPIREFPTSPSEISSNDPTQLSRKFIMQLRYGLK